MSAHRHRTAWCLGMCLTVACGAEKDRTLPSPNAEAPRVVSANVPAATPDRPREAAAVRAREPRRAGECRADPEACVRAAVDLTRTDLARAASVFEAACDAGSAAGCGNLAVMLRDGRGIEPDPARARTLLQYACDHGNRRSCDELGEPVIPAAG